MKSEDSLLGQLTRLISNSDGSFRKTVGRQLLSLSLLALTAFTSTPIWAPESSIGAEGPDTVSRSSDNGLEGVWDVTVTIRDAAGNPLRSFRAMNMYMADGQFEEFGVGTPSLDPGSYACSLAAFDYLNDSNQPQRVSCWSLKAWLTWALTRPTTRPSRRARKYSASPWVK